MSDPTPEERAAVPDDAAPPDLALSDEDRQQVRQIERARYQAQIEAVRAEARLEMQREIARYQREQTLTSWAQDATSPRMDRPKALPVEPQLLTTFVLAVDAISTDLSAQFQTIIGRILTNDLIDFSESGSSGGADERDARAKYQDLVATYQREHPSATKVEALKAVNRAHPELYDAQRVAKGGH